MAEVINLRMARKARQRSDAQQQAAENRAKFGQTKAARAKLRSDEARAQNTIEAVDGACCIFLCVSAMASHPHANAPSPVNVLTAIACPKGLMPGATPAWHTGV